MMSHKKVSTVLRAAGVALTLLALLVVLPACGNTAPTISTTSVPDGGVGVAYSQTLAATGGTTPYAWSIASGTLPDGLSLDSSSGLISGTPISPGTWNYTVQVTDSVGGAATADLSITINTAVFISTWWLIEGEQGISYSQILTATGGATPYTWSIASGTLPDGLGLDSSTGVISGTPTTDGTFPFTIRVTDSGGGTATADLSIIINTAPTISTTSVPDGGVGVAYSQTLAATDGTTPYAWSIASGTLPDGLSLDSSSGVISGTPISPGTWNFTVQLTDSVGGAATADLFITISTAPIISTTSVPDSEVGVAYSQTLAATGGTIPYAWSIASGTLPDGLGLDFSTGLISGTPTTDGTFPFTIRVTDSGGGTATADLSITINTAPIISTTSVPHGWLWVGVAYSQTLAATGGTTPYTWSIASGTLPDGLSLDSSSGVISGTPISPGTWDFTVQVSDSGGGTATATFTIQVTVSGGGTPTADLSITTSVPDGEVGVAYSQTLAATGGTTPYTWSITSGTLPDGLGLDSSTGLISGTPISLGTFPFTIRVTDSGGGAATAALSIIINTAPTISTASLPDGGVGVAYSQTLAATGGTTPYTWSITSGTLPDGLGLDSSTGVISGTPTTDGTSPFTIRVTDSGGGAATADLSITINT